MKNQKFYLFVVVIAMSATAFMLTVTKYKLSKIEARQIRIERKMDRDYRMRHQRQVKLLSGDSARAMSGRPIVEHSEIK